MEQLVGRSWTVWGVTPVEVMRDMSQGVLDELAGELEARLGLSRRTDGRAVVDFVESSGGGGLLTLAAEVDHNKTRSCVPASVDVAADGGSLVESFEAVVVLNTKLKTRCALLTAGSPRLGIRVVEWLEQRFDCYALRVSALTPEILGRVATRWIAATDARSADTTVALSFASPADARGVADITLELPLSALSLPRTASVSSSQDIAEVVALVSKRLCGVDTSSLQLLAFSTPDASLNTNAEVSLFSHAFPLSLLLELANN